MYAGVIHTVKDREAWAEILRNIDPSSFPEGFELLATGTADDTSRTICLWRAPSLDALQAMLDEGFGQVLINDCFAVTDESVVVAGQQQSAAAV